MPPPDMKLPSLCFLLIKICLPQQPAVTPFLNGALLIHFPEVSLWGYISPFLQCGSSFRVSGGVLLEIPSTVLKCKPTR